jgi:hypothetical protein
MGMRAPLIFAIAVPGVPQLAARIEHPLLRMLGFLAH